MCGIAGFTHEMDPTCASSIVQDMSRTLTHRGPDGKGTYIDSHIAIAHRRLAILDQSIRGLQPMASRDGKWQMAFNGYISNYKTLRQMLKDDHEFSSSSDTEVLVEAWSRLGIDIIPKLNGMFAFAAWNPTTQKLYLCRDRYGTKPLYYVQRANAILFASEIKPLLRHPCYETQLDKRALMEYFCFQNVFSNRTLFSGIHMLEAGTLLEYDTRTGKQTSLRWHEFIFNDDLPRLSMEEYAAETRRLLEQAITKQMASDVPIGCYLSGGIDSSSIATIARRIHHPLLTFTAGFEMSAVNGFEADFDERKAARQLSQILQSTHHELEITSRHMPKVLNQLIYHIEDLRMGMSYPNFLISKLASTKIKVGLQGIGGDEFFAGYPWRYQLSRPDRDGHYQSKVRLVPTTSMQKLFSFAIEQDELEWPRRAFDQIASQFPSRLENSWSQQISSLLFFDIKTFLSGLLTIADRTSMASGIEERYPFLDNDLVDFSLQLPAQYKISRRQMHAKIERSRTGYQAEKFCHGKYILREALKPILPTAILERPKQGFSSPESSWLRGPNQAFVRKILLGDQSASKAWLSQQFVSEIIDQHSEGIAEHRLLLWSLLSFEAWCRLFINGEYKNAIPDL